MSPSLELRIRSMMRAMTEAVIPALDPQDALAQEQARLVLGHLHALSLQYRHEPRCESTERAALERLAGDLGGDVASIDARIRSAMASGVAAEREATSRLVLAHAKSAALLGNAWFTPMGFARDPAALPAIDTLFEGDSE